MDRVLLDTHVFLWALAAPDRLSEKARGILQDEGAELLLSVVSPWELAIKLSVGKLHLPCELGAFVAQGCRQLGASLLPIELTHVQELAALPMHHRDPFDRMLIAQARADRLQLMSFDRAMGVYEVGRVG